MHVFKGVVWHDTGVENPLAGHFKMGRPENQKLELFSSVERMSNCM